MRLPLSKVYRAFPELDRFSDQECRQFVHRAQTEHRWSQSLNNIAWTAAYAVFAYAAFNIVPVLRTSRFELGGVLVFPLLLGGYLAFMIWQRDRWLIRTISRKIQSTNCAKCGYSLLGLDIRSDIIDCPECGFANSISARGYKPEDFIASQAPSPAAPAADRASGT